MANDAGVANFIGSAIKNTFALTEGTGHGQYYVPMLSDIVAEMNGLDLAEAVKKDA